MANLDILEREDLVGRVADAGARASERELGRLAGAPLVGEVRTVGLTAAVELSADVAGRRTRAPSTRWSPRPAATAC